MNRCVSCSRRVPDPSYEPRQWLRDGDERRLLPLYSLLQVQHGPRLGGLEPSDEPVHGGRAYCHLGDPERRHMHGSVIDLGIKEVYLVGSVASVHAVSERTHFV